MTGTWDLTDAGLLVGRLAITPMFVASIWDKALAPPGERAQVRSLGLPRPGLVERLTGVFEACCVIAIATGIGARLGATALAAFTLVVTFALLRFWRLEASEETTLKRTLFYNNLSAVGGLVLVITLGPGGLTL